MRRFLPTVLDATAIVCMFAALAMVVIPLRGPSGTDGPPLGSAIATGPSVPNPLSTDASVAPVGMGSLDPLAEQLINTNLFSASRRAPRSAFLPPGVANGATEFAATSADIARESEPGHTNTPDIVLEGIVRQDGRAWALISLRPPLSDGGDATASPLPRLLTVGGQIGNFRVRTIGSDQVVLTSVRGTRTLRLHRPPSSDSSVEIQ